MRRILAAVAVTVTLLAAAACTSKDDHPAKPAAGTKVTLGVIPILDVAPAYLGKQKGFFAKRGIDLSMTLEQGGGPIIKNVLGGKYQFGFSNITSLMSAENEGAQLKALTSGVASTGRPGRDFSAVVVRDGSLIRSAKDLAGKRISVNILKNVGDTTVRESVRKAGGDPRGIKFQALPFPAVAGALQNGTVDAAWVVEPTLSEVITQGGQVIASNFVDTSPGMTVAAYFTTSDVITRDPSLVTRFTAAVNESLTYASSHPDEVRAVIGTYTPINDVVRNAMILPSWPIEINKVSVERLAALGREDGILTKEPALDKLLP
jgi:NitT/TauT family transport system substrate-binding protein